jgi:hypothetical protein
MTMGNLKKNSPSTTITSPILAGATTIPVADTSVFYDSAGALITAGIVIAFDNATVTLAEEITITGASTTSGAGNLTGVTRGVNADGTIGQAVGWSTGTKIAVMFSTGIYNGIKTATNAASQAAADASSLAGLALIMSLR